MIHTNETPTSKNPKQGPSSPPPPPSYAGYQADPEVQPYPQTYVGYAGVVPQQTAGQRFIRAFLVGTLIWLLFSMLAQSSFSVIHWGHRHGRLILDEWDYKVPAGITLDQCVRGWEWTPSILDVASFLSMANSSAVHKSETSFNVPLSSDTLFFLSRGQLLGGTASVTTSPEQAPDSATVNVKIYYNREELLDLSKACLISRGEGENGVGLFTPEWRYSPGREYHVQFEITVILPEFSGDAAPLSINKFETDFSNSIHLIGDLNDKVIFNSISLRGSNGAIGVKSLTATNAKLQSSNGPISGTFNTTKSLVLYTSNSPIRVDVGLESDKDGSSPSFNARTSNGKLEASVSLVSATGSGGSFNVATITSNSPLRVDFPASPLDSKLTLQAKTSNSPAAVSLNPAYEGSFVLTASRLGATVRRKSGVEDPAGKERERRVNYRADGNRIISGNVYWKSDKNKELGLVSVQTSNSPLVLEI